MPFNKARSVGRSVFHAGYLFSLNTYAVMSLVCCGVNVAGASAGIVACTRSKKSATVRLFQLPRNSMPTSEGPASPPDRSGPWQLVQSLVETASPRLACSSVNAPPHTLDTVVAGALCAATPALIAKTSAAAPTVRLRAAPPRFGETRASVFFPHSTLM